MNAQSGLFLLLCVSFCSITVNAQDPPPRRNPYKLKPSLIDLDCNEKWLATHKCVDEEYLSYREEQKKKIPGYDELEGLENDLIECFERNGCEKIPELKFSEPGEDLEYRESKNCVRGLMEGYKYLVENCTRNKTEDLEFEIPDFVHYQEAQKSQEGGEATIKMERLLKSLNSSKTCPSSINLASAKKCVDDLLGGPHVLIEAAEKLEEAASTFWGPVRRKRLIHRKMPNFCGIEERCKQDHLDKWCRIKWEKAEPVICMCSRQILEEQGRVIAEDINTCTAGSDLVPQFLTTHPPKVREKRRLGVGRRSFMWDAYAYLCQREEEKCPENVIAAPRSRTKPQPTRRAPSNRWQKARNTTPQPRRKGVKRLGTTPARSAIRNRFGTRAPSGTPVTRRTNSRFLRPRNGATSRSTSSARSAALNRRFQTFRRRSPRKAETQ